jgi:predicted DNA-binding protein
MFDRFFKLRIDERTSDKLSALSKELHRTKSNLIRWLIVREYERLTLENLIQTHEKELMK